MNENWANRLTLARDQLTRRECELIEFISAHPQEAAFLRQADLCARAGVSKPLVISCFRRLGYADYQEFLEGIQGFYAGQIDSAQAATVAFKDIGDVAGLVAQALKVEAATLETLGRHLVPSQVEAVARALLNAGVIYLYAEGSGLAPAQYLAQRLRRCGLRAVLVGGDRPHVLDDLAPLRTGDLFLTFFYTQDSDLVAGLMELAASRGVTTVLVTGTPDPELFELVTFHLFVPRGQWNFKNSLAAPMAFAQILLLAVEFLGGSDLHSRLKTLESTRREFGSQKKDRVQSLEKRGEES